MLLAPKPLWPDTLRSKVPIEIPLWISEAGNFCLELVLLW